MCHLHWQIEQDGHLVFPISLKDTNLVEDVENLLPVKFRWIPFGGCWREVENVSAHQRPGQPSCFFQISPKTQTWQRTLRSCFLSCFVEFPWTVIEKSKMSQPIRGQGSHLIFPISPKNTNLLEDVEILLPVKFHWIRFKRFREEVENFSANQRPGLPSYFSNQPEKHKLGRGRWDLASRQASLNSVQTFQRRSQKFLSRSEARVAILFFDQPEKHKLGRRCWHFRHEIQTQKSPKNTDFV